MPSATRADSSDSNAASAATARAGAARSRSVGRSITGSAGAGRPAGSAPIRSTGSPASSVTTVTTTIASSEIGSFGKRLPGRCSAMVSPATSSGATAADQSACRRVW